MIRVIKSQNNHPLYHRDTLYITPPEYNTPGDEFFEGPNVITGGVVYTVVYGTKPLYIIRISFLVDFLVHVFVCFYTCCLRLWFERVRHVGGESARGCIPSTQPTEQGLVMVTCGTPACVPFSGAVRDRLCFSMAHMPFRIV